MLGGLFLLEVFWLSVRFDTTPLLAYDYWWTDALGLAPAAIGVLFAVGAATILAVRTGDGHPVPLPTESSVAFSYRFWWLVGHFLLFALFSSLTRTVLERDLSQSSIAPGVWLAGWLAAGLAMVLLLAGAALPIRSWWRMLRRGWLVLAVALLIGVSAWTAGELTGSYWSPLHSPTFKAVERVLGHLGQEVKTGVRDYTVTVTGSNGDFSVFIDQTCSGYQGIGLIWVFLLAFLWLDRRNLRFPNALILLPVGTALVWVLNVFRLASLMIIGAWVSEGIALGGFHSQMGWLSFLAVSLGIAAAANQSRFLSNRSQTLRDRGLTHPEASYLLPFVVLMALAMVTAAFSEGFDWLYPIRVLGTGAVLLAYWGGSLRSQVKGSLGNPGNLALGLAAALMWIAIGLLRPPDQAGVDPGEILAESPLAVALVWVFFRLVGAVLVVPAAEELAFRGYLTRRLISGDFDIVPPGSLTWFSFISSSLAFGLFHQRWVAGTVVGMLFAFAYFRRGRIGDAIVVHGITNSAVAIFVSLTGHWWLW